MACSYLLKKVYNAQNGKINSGTGGVRMSDFDVFECIRNVEIREFYRKKGLSVWEQIQVILHSYASMKQKREWLLCLLQQTGDEERRRISKMIELIDTCLCQLYQTEENVVYIAERRYASMNRTQAENIGVPTSEGAELTFYDEMSKMIECLSATYALKPDEANCEIYIFQLIKTPNEKHQIKLEFSMTWISGKLEVFRVYPDKEWLRRKGFSEETLDAFGDVGMSYKELPFKKGDRLKIKTPLMTEYIHGALTHAEYDGCGCWYYFFTPDGKEKNIDTKKYVEDMIVLNYHEIDLTSGYVVFDWVERE